MRDGEIAPSSVEGFGLLLHVQRSAFQILNVSTFSVQLLLVGIRC